MTKAIIFLWTFIFLTTSYGQDISSKYKLNIKFNKKSASKKIVPHSDSLNIVFLYNYAGDIVRFKTRDVEVVSDTLRADEFYGIGGSLKIAKSILKSRVKIYFNNQYIGSIKVNKHYSSVHLEYNRKNRIFTWRYHKYKFGFI